jgi:glutamate-1-semialdehyde 2,1-aminomutase
MSLAPTVMVNYPQAVPDSAGISEHVRDNTIVAPFNDAEVVTQFLDAYGHEIAGIIVEPLQRLIPPAPGFLEHLRAETAKRGIVLIFDEVVTGFRLAYGGAQEVYGVTPDLCTLGKIIGGGFPLAAIAGSDEIMAHFDKARVGPEGFTYQVGTLSGNPVAAVAGLKTMEILRRPGVYAALRATGEKLMATIRGAFAEACIPVQVVGDATLFDAIFTEHPVTNYRGVLTSNPDRARRYNGLMRERGILKPDSKMYPSTALTDADIAQTTAAIREAAEIMGRDGA